MENSYEKSPFYRLLNVILFILYSFVVLLMIVGTILGYSSRQLTSASVVCKDGTRWDATKILYDSNALCGICTQRQENGKYNYCSYQNIDYNSYNVVDQKYSWSWNTVIYPLIVFAIGFGIVDILRIIVIYILSGRIALDKSILLKILVLLYSQDNKKNATETFERQYKNLFEFESKDDIIKNAELQTKVATSIQQNDIELDAFYKKSGKDAEFFQKGNVISMDLATIEEYFKLDDQRKEMELYHGYFSRYFEILEKINQMLLQGLSKNEVRKEYEKENKQLRDGLAERKINLVAYKTLSEEILKAKKENKPITKEYILKKIQRNIKSDQFFKKGKNITNCLNCDEKLELTAKFCPKCGTPVKETNS